MKTLNRIYVALIIVFLYAPILVMMLFSFNSTVSTAVFSGFSLKWYGELFAKDEVAEAMKNTLFLAALSSVIATLLGTAAAVGISRMPRKWRSPMLTVTNIPMMNPDIVTGISMMLLFVFVCVRLAGAASLSFVTVLIAHITFNLPYVILNVMPKLKQMDASLTDAAMDLGCTPWQAFFRVTLHEIMPGVVSGAIMAFTMSLDDFVISYFVTGLDFVTLPVEIYSYTKKPIQPKIYAMFTLLFLLIFVLMTAMNLMQVVADRKKIADRKGH